MIKLPVILAIAFGFTTAACAQMQPPAPAAVSTADVQAPVPGPAPAAGHPQVANVSPDYVIGPGDSLEINVWKEPTISGTLPVRPDGMISLSLVGDMQASGLTPAHLSSDITERLRKFINDPAVTVTVLAVNSKHIFLLGEVSKPGEMPLSPGLTPLQAIASAGGLTAYASAKHIYILRNAGGQQQKIKFDYKLAIKSGNLQGVTLVSGDTIVVP